MGRAGTAAPAPGPPSREAPGSYPRPVPGIRPQQFCAPAAAMEAFCGSRFWVSFSLLPFLPHGGARAAPAPPGASRESPGPGRGGQPAPAAAEGLGGAVPEPAVPPLGREQQRLRSVRPSAYPRQSQDSPTGHPTGMLPSVVRLDLRLINPGLFLSVLARVLLFGVISMTGKVLPFQCFVTARRGMGSWQPRVVTNPGGLR